MGKNKNIVAVDVGGTKILACVLSSQGKIISRAKKPTKDLSNKNDTIERIIITIEDAITKSKLKFKDITHIVLGIPGSLNPSKGIVYLAPNLGWKNLNIVEPLEKYFNKEILIENDANLGTLGIFHYQLYKEINNLITLFIGTGVGAGIIINKKLFQGKNYSAGEIGHMVVNPNGVICGCGNIGCFETEASRLAITRFINESISNNKKSIITELVKDTSLIKSSALAKAIKMKDEVVIEAVNRASQNIGLMVGNLINLFDFDAIVFAGGVIEAIGYFMLPRIKKSAKEVALKNNYRKTKFLINKLKDDSAIYGSIALVRENF